jgi:deoxyribonuclease-4
MPTLRIGAHVDQADPVQAALDRGADLSQFFLGDPQGYKGPEFRYDGGADALRAAAEEAGIDLYVHAPYIINVATTNNRIRIPSRKLLQQHIDAATSIGAKALIVHGGHVNAKDNPEDGFENWAKAVERTNLTLPVLIENTAGGDKAMARRLEMIARLWDAVGDLGAGFCLDTCHAHAGGEDLVGIVERVKAITGRVDLVHANDSRDAFDSGADRHANFGSGQIDPDLIVAVCKAAGSPVVVETPADGQATDIALIRAAV